MKILMVCLGNICRSPLAEEILRKMAQQGGLAWQVDSAGTSSLHAGEKPHSGSVNVASQHQLDISHQRARQVIASDFEQFDVIFALDLSVYNMLKGLSPSTQAAAKVKLLLRLVPDTDTLDVHDPYYDHRFLHTYNQLHHAISYIVQNPSILYHELNQ
jgi:protein-tyrosine phosphatase